MATFDWLYQNDPEPTRQLQHLARECVAAARAGARAEFARTFHLLAGQETDSDAASARSRTAKPGGKQPEDRHALIASSEADARRETRRTARSADWQRALLVVARDSLTALVDADDQADLAILVATLKRHLDEAGRGPVDDELTTLYRAASAHLKAGARAYAETVGAERRPILLGDIRVDRTYDVRPPAIDLTGVLEEARDAAVRAAGARPDDGRALDGETFSAAGREDAMNPWAALTGLLVFATLAATARAQSLVEVVPEDPCAQAGALDPKDDSATAEQLRRACRLQRFDRHLAAERRQQVVAAEEARSARIERWIDRTQPARVTRPFSVDAFVGTGVASFGVALGWAFLRKAELAAWLGKRTITCADLAGPEAGDCSRTVYGLRGRWYPLGTKVSPFLAGGLTIANAHLQLLNTDGQNGNDPVLRGSGRANCYNLGAGVQLASAWFRLSMEYVYEHAFYTGASASDAKKTPNRDLNTVWSTSLNDDQHGVRFQVGIAF